MKKSLLTLACISLIAGMAMGQQRYLEEVFTDVDVTSDVKYGENYSILTGMPVLGDLLMDVYEPNGDTVTDRPLIIMAHAGSFLPKGPNQLPLGTKTDSCMVEMCMQFAKRGWVAASIDYRLGWNPTSTDPDVRAETIINAVYRAMQDMKACVRYFKSESGTYSIDTTKITVGGSNSGGYMALAYASLNKASELQLLKFKNSMNGNPYVDQAVTGGFDGEGGAMGVNNYSNPGHSSEVQLALNLGGAIGDTSWQEAGEIPIVSFHGIEDALTPYKTSVVIVAATMQSVVEVSGSHDLSRYATALGNQELYDDLFNDPHTMVAKSRTDHKGLFPFPGAANGFEPWGWYDPNDPNAVGMGGSAANPAASPAKGRAYIDTIMGYFCPRAVQVLGLPGSTVGINDISSESPEINLYPNPAKNSLTVKSDKNIQTITITDITGKKVMELNDIRSKEYKIQRTSDIYKGLYLVTVVAGNNTTTQRVVFE